jgi:DNA mismatch repair ATPase MutL
MSIIENLSKTKNSLHCPHGRPTLIEIEIKNLFREFERT